MSSAAFGYPHKSAEAFRTISEVAIELDVPQHVLRFWESRFTQIKPVKRAGGRRYYRPEDIDLLKGIRALLYSDGLTIRGVQKVLKERGMRHVTDLGRGEAPQPQVIEKIVYVEKTISVPQPQKRPNHLRAVSDTLDLPFFDPPPPRDFPIVDAAPVPPGKLAAPEEEQTGLLPDEQERLEEILDELMGLKARLQSARSEVLRA
jgi:DNA-binding transcriptional MerR regulator